jgi:enoyl-CoA hydratase/carnithine racemase
VVEALERDNFMDPEQAKDWGLIDEIVETADLRTVAPARYAVVGHSIGTSPNMRLWCWDG